MDLLMGESITEVEPGILARVLRASSPEEIHARMVETDPLRLRALSARRLRERWFLLDPDRVYLRSLAVVAHAAARAEGLVPDECWVREQVDRAIDQLVRADLEAERAGPEVLRQEDLEFPLMTKCLMIEPELVRKLSVAFNQLEELPRRAFFELLIEARELGEVIESGPWDEDGLYEAVTTGMAAVGLGDGKKNKPPEEVKP